MIPAADPPVACAYEVDFELRLVAVDAAFTRFADANGAPELRAPACLGRSVPSCISDPTSVHLWRRLFDRVRATGEALTVPIRCDSPRYRRHLSLIVEPLPSGFRIHSRVDRMEERPPQELLETARTGDGTALRMCSWCNKVAVAGDWVEVEEALRTLRLFERTALPAITHGICQPCYATIDGTAGTSHGRRPRAPR